MEVPCRKSDNDTFSMLDVLKQNIELEEEATAVLGDSDDICCTYSTGYQERQALYACNTCSLESEQCLAGICLACSYACHDGHELYELYTKRRFRCDCGNNKFPKQTCKLIPDKSPANEDNKYNQNFRGLYCTCHRPYPDPEDEVEDEMIQCVICEDWFHGRHLGIEKLPSNYEYEEMVCRACMKEYDFLWTYRVHGIEVTAVKEDIKEDVDVESMEQSPGHKSGSEINTCQIKGTSEMKESSAEVKIENIEVTETKSVISTISECTPVIEAQSEQHQPTHDTVRLSEPQSAKSATETDSTEHQSGQTTQDSKPTHADPPPNLKSTADIKESSITEVTVESKVLSDKMSSDDVKMNKEEGNGVELSSSCQLEQLRKRVIKISDGAVFWNQGWRSKLCTCTSCKDLLERLHLPFLTSSTDSVLSYEERGKRNQSGLSQYEKGMQALSNLDRIQQVEILHGFNDMKSELQDFLRSFANNGQVVKREDIDEFFTEMQARKRQKTTGQPQYFCR